MGKKYENLKSSLRSALKPFQPLLLRTCRAPAFGIMRSVRADTTAGVLALAVVLLLAVACAAGGAAPSSPQLALPPFQQPDVPLQRRLDDLMRRLSREDLVNQLGGPGIGTINRSNLTLQGTSYGEECLSGVDSTAVPGNGTGTSAFPNPVNLGMSWDTELVEAVGTAIGDEKRALFNAKLSAGSLCLSPVLNQARDPRSVAIHTLRSARCMPPPAPARSSSTATTSNDAHSVRAPSALWLQVGTVVRVVW